MTTSTKCDSLRRCAWTRCPWRFESEAGINLEHGSLMARLEAIEKGGALNCRRSLLALRTMHDVGKWKSHHT
jgi:hypothetical protein